MVDTMRPRKEVKKRFLKMRKGESRKTGKGEEIILNGKEEKTGPRKIEKGLKS